MKRNPAGRFIAKHWARWLISRSYSYRVELLIYSCGMWCVCPNTLWLWVGCFSQVLTGAAEPWYVAKGKHKCVKDVKKWNELEGTSWAEQTSFKQKWWYSFVCSYSHTHTNLQLGETRYPGNTHLSLRCVFQQFIRVLLLLHHICSNITKQKVPTISPHFCTTSSCQDFPSMCGNASMIPTQKNTKKRKTVLVQMRLAGKKPLSG